MASIIPHKDRKVIPKWRGFAETARHGELISRAPQQRELDFDNGHIEKLREEFDETKSLTIAFELVSAATAMNATNGAQDAAEFVLKKAPNSFSLARELAQSVLVGFREDNEQPPQLLGGLDVKKLATAPKDFVKRGRRLLELYPRNPILWVELARAHTTLGNADRAFRAMQTALSLAPANRFVLRAATRYFVHVGEPNRALYALDKGLGDGPDPWLISAHIAVCSSLGKSSKFVRKGRELIKYSADRAHSLSEVASAIGTLEYENGSMKAARKLFGFSMIDPTENALAQLIWVFRVAEKKSIPEDVATSLPIASAEGDAWNAFQARNWQKCLDSALHWLRDQPFSSRPSMLGSFVAASALDQHGVAIQLANWGLKSSPHDFPLLNNLAYSLAKLSRPSEALDALKRIDPSQLSETERATFSATSGLIQYRLGNPVAGKALYLEALKVKNEERRVLAAANLAIEELRVNKEEGVRLANQALQAYEDHPHIDSEPIVNKLRKILEQPKNSD